MNSPNEEKTFKNKRIRAVQNPPEENNKIILRDVKEPLSK